jgi:hypothetical protein
MDLMAQRPAAEDVVRKHLAGRRRRAGPALAYARVLMARSATWTRIAQLEQVTREKPDLAPPYLMLGALHLELRHPREGRGRAAALPQLSQARSRRPGRAAAATMTTPTPPRPDQGLVQAWLMLAQAAEQRGDFAAAEAWLARIDDPKRALEVQTRRATLMARQGKVAERRELVRRAPERKPATRAPSCWPRPACCARSSAGQTPTRCWARAAQRFPDDPDLLYEQAMVAEKLDRPGRHGAAAAPVIASSPTTRMPTTRWAIRWPTAACACPRRAT